MATAALETASRLRSRTQPVSASLSKQPWSPLGLVSGRRDDPMALRYASAGSWCMRLRKGTTPSLGHEVQASGERLVVRGLDKERGSPLDERPLSWCRQRETMTAIETAVTPRQDLLVR